MFPIDACKMNFDLLPMGIHDHLTGGSRHFSKGWAWPNFLPFPPKGEDVDSKMAN